MTRPATSFMYRGKLHMLGASTYTIFVPGITCRTLQPGTSRRTTSKSQICLVVMADDGRKKDSEPPSFTQEPRTLRCHTVCAYRVFTVIASERRRSGTAY